MARGGPFFRFFFNFFFFKSLSFLIDTNQKLLRLCKDSVRTLVVFLPPFRTPPPPLRAPPTAPQDPPPPPQQSKPTYSAIRREAAMSEGSPSSEWEVYQISLSVCHTAALACPVEAGAPHYCPVGGRPKAGPQGANVLLCVHNGTQCPQWIYQPSEGTIDPPRQQPS